MIEEFLRAISAERNSSFNTLGAYRADLLAFKKFLEKLQIEQIDQATPNSIKKFILSLHSKSYNRSTISRKTTVLRQFYKFLYSEKIIKENPASNIELPKKIQKIPSYLTQKEIDVIFTFLQSQKDSATNIPHIA